MQSARYNFIPNYTLSIAKCALVRPTSAYTSRVLSIFPNLVSSYAYDLGTLREAIFLDGSCQIAYDGQHHLTSRIFNIEDKKLAMSRSVYALAPPKAELVREFVAKYDDLTRAIKYLESILTRFEFVISSTVMPSDSFNVKHTSTIELIAKHGPNNLKPLWEVIRQSSIKHTGLLSAYTQEDLDTLAENSKLLATATEELKEFEEDIQEMEDHISSVYCLESL